MKQIKAILGPVPPAGPGDRELQRYLQRAMDILDENTREMERRLLEAAPENGAWRRD